MAEHWAAIEQALERIENGEGLADDVNILPLLPALQAAWKAVGVAKRRESELAEELEVLRESELEWQRREDRSIRAEARVAELERALEALCDYVEAVQHPWPSLTQLARTGREALGARREATGE